LANLLELNGTQQELERLAGDVADKRLDPYSAVEALLRLEK